MKRIAFLLLAALFVLQACAPAMEPVDSNTVQGLVPPVMAEEPYDASLPGAANSAPDSAAVPALCDGAEDANAAAFAAEVIRLTNEERAKVGAGALTSQSQLTDAAQKHAIDMACNEVMGHEGSDGSTMSDRIKQFGYAYAKAGENVAGGNSTPAAVVASWMSSEGHRKNMLHPDFVHIGIGYVYNPGDMFKHSWVMDLGKPK